MSSTAVTYGFGTQVLNSTPAYSLQKPKVYQDVLACDYKFRTEPYYNVGDYIPRGLGAVRSNWPFGGGVGIVQPFTYDAPYAHDMPFNPRTRIPYWDKLPITPARDPYVNPNLPFLNEQTPVPY